MELVRQDAAFAMELIKRMQTPVWWKNCQFGMRARPSEPLTRHTFSLLFRALRRRAQDTQRRKELELRLTGRGVSADAGSLRMSSPVKCCDDDSISRTNSMVTGQRKLMRQLMAIDSSIDVSHIIDMMDEQSMPREAATPRASVR
eukprot:731715-Pleurochrysis_carterae.AAC.1